MIPFPHSKKTSLAFTLIEILVVLVILSILSLMTAGLIRQAVTTSRSVTQVSDYLSQISMTLLLMQRDFSAAFPRKISQEQGGNLQAAFIGRPNYLSFIRGGWLNPEDNEQRSTLQRIGYETSNQSLMRLTWPVLETAITTKPQTKIWLNQLKQVSFEYLDSHHIFQSSWDSDTYQGLPRAIRVTLTLEQGGSCRIIFRIPAGLPFTPNKGRT